MSRESDTSSSGAQGRGGAAYPSGTPPYGSRQYPSLHPQDAAYDGREAAEAEREPGTEEPRTETTLTTRVRINIPGSRPIPPVVMRKPVDEGTVGKGGAATGGTTTASGVVGAPPSTPAAQEPPKPRPAPESGGTKTSDWFAPRKPSAASPAPSSAPPAPSGPGPSGGPSAPAEGDRQRSDLPYFSEGAGAPDPAAGSPGLEAGRGPHGSVPAFGSGIGSGPAGPTTGPNSGDAPGLQEGGPQLPPPGLRGPGGPGQSGPAAHGQAGPGAPGMQGQSGPGQAGPGRKGDLPNLPGAFLSGGAGAQVPAQPPAHGIGAVSGGFTGPGTGAAPGPDREPEFSEPEHVSGDTLVSGIPAVPSGGSSPFPPSGGGSPFPPAPGSEDEDGYAEPSAPRSAKKGRSKLVLIGAGLVGVVGVAYGAGLLLDHADVPNGTTVLGFDIGGTSKEQAVRKLDNVLNIRTKAPLKVTVDGKEQQLKPSAAGLDIDTEATVQKAAGRDYNPVSVIGSLFGGSREAEPVITVDEEKLAAALKALAGETGAGQDGGIKFVGGKAVPVPGRTHKAINVEQSVAAVGKAYRDRAATGRTVPVELPVGMQKPSVDAAEIARAMKEFAEPAMSGLVTVQTDPAHQIAFSPENSLPKFLSMKAVGGRLVDTYDLKVLQKLYGGTFDGVLIQRANGQKTPVTPQDVAGALRQALKGKTAAERVGVIRTNPQ